MSVQQGQSDSFRQPTLVETVAARLGGLLPAVLRRAARPLYSGLLGLVAPGRLAADLPGGERVTLLPGSRQMRWNPLEYQAFKADVRQGDVVFDIGANIGAYTLLFAQWAGPHGRVVAFEPAPDAYRALTAVLEANGLSDRVTALQQAVSNAEGAAGFAADGHHGANRLSKLSPGLSVRTTTVDAVCRHLNVRPRLIKIDVEGAELDVLRGARETLRRVPDLRVYMEVHPAFWSEFGASREALEAELRFQELRLERLDGGRDVWELEGVCLRLVRCGS